MADPQDLEALARRYLDLWHEQAAAMAANPALADIFAKLFGALAPGGFAQPPFTPGGSNDERTAPPGSGGPAGGPGATQAAGPATDGAASVADHGGIDECLRRIARLEERIAALESGRGE